jgi:hypothetical protein
MRVQVLLESVVLRGSNIRLAAIFSRRSIRPGQAAILDFTPVLWQLVYQTMARTQTISSSNSWCHKNPGEDSQHNPVQVLELTMQEKPGEAVTGALFTLSVVRKPWMIWGR